MIAITKNRCGNRVGTIRSNNSSADRNAVIVNIDGGARFSAASITDDGKRIITGDFIGSTCAGILCNGAEGGRTWSSGIDSPCANRSW